MLKSLRHDPGVDQSPQKEADCAAQGGPWHVHSFQVCTAEPQLLHLYMVAMPCLSSQDTSVAGDLVDITQKHHGRTSDRNGTWKDRLISSRTCRLIGHTLATLRCRLLLGCLFRRALQPLRATSSSFISVPCTGSHVQHIQGSKRRSQPLHNLQTTLEFRRHHIVERRHTKCDEVCFGTDSPASAALTGLVAHTSRAPLHTMRLCCLPNKSQQRSPCSVHAGIDF